MFYLYINWIFIMELMAGARATYKELFNTYLFCRGCRSLFVPWDIRQCYSWTVLNSEIINREHQTVKTMALNEQSLYRYNSWNKRGRPSSHSPWAAEVNVGNITFPLFVSKSAKHSFWGFKYISVRTPSTANKKSTDNVHAVWIRLGIWRKWKRW